MSSLQDLMAQKAALDKKIVEVQREERTMAIGKIRALMAEYGLTVSDIAGKPSAGGPKVKSGAKVAPKYRNTATGETWSGRGLQPKWLKAALASGRALSEFAL